MTRQRGSPPRVRGEAWQETTVRNVHRITPACAGRSTVYRGGDPAAEDHPRVCGEKTDCFRYQISKRGSPPRVRGEVTAPAAHLNEPGITPACAGRSAQLQHCDLRREDHPRVCGETCRPPARSGERLGSPPRVRGEASVCVMTIRLRRITPACAGRR